MALRGKFKETEAAEAKETEKLSKHGLFADEMYNLAEKQSKSGHKPAIFGQSYLKTGLERIKCIKNGEKLYISPFFMVDLDNFQKQFS